MAPTLGFAEVSTLGEGGVGALVEETLLEAEETLLEAEEETEVGGGGGVLLLEASRTFMEIGSNGNT